MADERQPISRVHSIGHVENWQKNGDAVQLLEIYTGWVALNFNQYNDDDDLRGEIRTFLPTSKSMVKVYLMEQADKLISLAVTAAPAAISANEDETIDAIDAARVKLERQSLLPGISATMDVGCLILRADTAIRNSIFHSFTYQVTAL
ncbi:hypothetical protein ACWGHA_40205 [Streptomyces xanthophaeus]